MADLPTVAQLEAASPDWLDFYRASEWGVKWARPPVAERVNDPEAYIHHTAGSRKGTDPIRAMQLAQDYAHNTRGFSTIGYDIQVHRNTDTNRVAILGARENYMSAATKHRNEEGEAICLYGYFHPGSSLSEQPTNREIEALAWAVAWSMCHGWNAPDTIVKGHRDNPRHPNETACPGNYLYAYVPAIGRRVYEVLDLARTGVPTPPTNPEEDDLNWLRKPKRIYDSREHTPLKVGETRMITHGKFATVCAANLTVITDGSVQGYVSMAGEADAKGTSITNPDSDGVSNGTFLGATPDGKLFVYAGGPNANQEVHFAVDLLMYGVGTVVDD